MKKPPLFCAGLICLLLLTLQLHAEDSVVNLEADAAGLSLVAPTDLPTSGTYWLVLPGAGVMAPSPCPPADPNLPVYALADNGQFLVDQTAGGYGMSAAALLAQANSVSNLILQVQTKVAAQALRRNAGFHSLSSSGPPSPGGGNELGEDDDFTNVPYVIPWDTNQLWLEITNVSNGTAYLNAHHATNGIYGVWSTTDLLTPFNQWQAVQDVWTTNGMTNVLPFTVNISGADATFYRLEDWTGITTNGLPLWWLFENFGDFNHASDDMDTQSNDTLGNDYLYGTDPNRIQFNFSLPIEPVTSNAVNSAISVIFGDPARRAVLVNDTNTADAVWQPYTSSNFVVNLAQGSGVYNVMVGLQGGAKNAQAVWQTAQVVLYVEPLVLTVTNPTNGTVGQPMIQLQGLANKNLSELTYDVSNSAGVITNETGYWQPVAYDTNLWVMTTNTFQCYDVPLTIGTNCITLHATDLAGNMVSTNLNYTLVPTTNPPVMALVWPLPAAVIGGNRFTLQAKVEDPTATVTASITDTNDATNIVVAIVERNGNIWAENLPLNAGTNRITLTATNYAGLVNVTNFTVVQSAVSLTVDPLAQPNQSVVPEITGTVSDPAQNVWVNGEPATVNEDGSWVAYNVPVNPTGTAAINVTAGSDAEHIVSANNINQPQPALVVLSSYTSNSSLYESYDGADGRPLHAADHNAANWLYQMGGGYDDVGFIDGDEFPYAVVPYHYAYSLSPDDSSGLVWADGLQHSAHGGDTAQSSTHARVMVVPSGYAQMGRTALYLVQAQVLDADSGLQLAASAVQFVNQMAGSSSEDVTNDDGSVWTQALVFAPAGVNVEVTPKATGNISYNGMVAGNVTLQIMDNNTGLNLSLQTNTVIVGQQMNFTAQLTSADGTLVTNFALTNFQWTVPGVTFSDYVSSAESAVLYTNYSTIQSNILFYWSDGATNRIVQCSAMVNGGKITGQATFNIIRPEVTWTLTPKNVVTVDTNFLNGNINDQLFPGYDYLHCGENRTTNDGGMFFSFQVTNLKGYTNDYAIQFYQIGTIDWKKNINFSGITGSESVNGRGYDVEFPVIWYQYSKTNGYRDDSPADLLTGQTTFLWRSDSFEDYLMFTPADGKPVPLKVAYWNWSGMAKQVATNAPPAFTGVMPFTNPVAATGVDCYIHPTWTNDLTSIKTNWTFHATTYPTP